MKNYLATLIVACAMAVVSEGALANCGDHFQKNEWLMSRCRQSGSQYVCNFTSNGLALKAAPSKFSGCYPTPVICRAPSTVILHKNGYLASCTLASGLTTSADGRTAVACREGASIEFDQQGRLIDCS
ncbi:hypothetical protein [Magnetospirillum sp. 15-1]|uniref:hypothetical protein n=1 Tax=Magnetospirillum sp. 15-1 TaxID=1979370 RepID=UPI0011425D17|nr:hypothetical protein [Magnetospirillum sp. 15-1]